MPVLHGHRGGTAAGASALMGELRVFFFFFSTGATVSF
jgi:hypothetical protein